MESRRFRFGARIDKIAISPDGKHVACSLSNKNIEVINFATGALELTLKNFWDIGITAPSVVYSPDGRHISSVFDSFKIRIWSASTGEVQRDLIGHTMKINSIVYSPFGRHIVSVSYDKTIRVWNAASGALEKTFEDPFEIYSIAISPDGMHIATESLDEDSNEITNGIIRIRNFATGSVERVLNNQKSSDAISEVVYHPDGRYIVSASTDSTARVWNTATGAVERTLDSDNHDYISSLVISPDGRHVVTGSFYKIKVWNFATGALEKTLEAVDSQCIAISPDGRYILSGSSSSNQIVQIWDTLGIFFPFLRDYEEYKTFISILEESGDKVELEIFVEGYPLILKVTVFKDKYKVSCAGDRLDLRSIVDKKKYEKVVYQRYSSIGQMIEDLYDKEMLDSNVNSTVSMGKRKRKRLWSLRMALKF